MLNIRALAFLTLAGAIAIALVVFLQQPSSRPEPDTVILETPIVPTATPALPAPGPTAIRPDQSQAKSLTEAEAELRLIPEIDAVFSAIETGDLTAVFDRIADGDYCGLVFRGGPLPLCVSGSPVPGVYIHTSRGIHLAPRTVYEEELREVIGSRPTLHFASRDIRYGTGRGSEYYLVFEVVEDIPSWRRPRFEKVGMMVKRGEQKPIRWITYVGRDFNGLQFIQTTNGEYGATYQMLIAPESVDDWPGYGER